MKFAIIDLGTNTCNLLIAEKENMKFNILHQSKQLVKLGDDKIRANEISPEAEKRTMHAFREHKRIINGFNVDQVRIIATSAVRSAENKIEYLENISEETGWIVKVVTGEKEADLIFKGVLLAFKKLDKPSLILDIGGGSNELIIAQNNKIICKESRPTGMARVINGFKLSDPILSEEIKMLQEFFLDHHQPMIARCQEQFVTSLIGCSGAFDTIADIIDEVDPGEKQRITQEIPIERFYKVYDKLIASSLNERIRIKGMDMVRVDLIVPAMILIEKLISEIGITCVTQTDFALREGVLFDLASTPSNVPG